MSHRGDIVPGDRSVVIGWRSNLNWRFIAIAMRTARHARARVKTDNDWLAAAQTSGQSVALLRMLKKYGTGWHTRMVRAQRS